VVPAREELPVAVVETPVLAPPLPPAELPPAPATPPVLPPFAPPLALLLVSPLAPAELPVALVTEDAPAPLLVPEPPLMPPTTPLPWEVDVPPPVPPPPDELLQEKESAIAPRQTSQLATRFHDGLCITSPPRLGADAAMVDVHPNAGPLGPGNKMLGVAHRVRGG
jgi:hypothetical protein